MLSILIIYDIPAVQPAGRDRRDAGDPLHGDSPFVIQRLGEQRDSTEVGDLVVEKFCSRPNPASWFRRA